MHSPKEKMLFFRTVNYCTPILNLYTYCNIHIFIFTFQFHAGTFITEWDDGKVRCHKVIESEESLKRAANKLVEITKYFQFDGWLINIENVVDVCCILFMDYQ